MNSDIYCEDASQCTALNIKRDGPSGPYFSEVPSGANESSCSEGGNKRLPEMPFEGLGGLLSH